MSKTLDLADFTGSETQYRHATGLIYTEGLRYVAEKAGAFWLIDAVASYQRDKRVRQDRMLQEFQLWELKLRTQGGAVLTCRRDSGEEPVIRQAIEFTDFPEDIRLYVENGVLLLPSEH